MFVIDIKNRFDSDASSTYKPLFYDPTFELEYQTGKLSGNKAKETVSVIEIKILV